MSANLRLVVDGQEAPEVVALGHQKAFYVRSRTTKGKSYIVLHVRHIPRVDYWTCDCPAKGACRHIRAAQQEGVGE